MNKQAKANWGWQNGVVNVQGEHIELRYGDAETTAYEQWLPIALIGKPKSHVFPVLWVMSPGSPSRERMIDAARKELDFYLVELSLQHGCEHVFQCALVILPE